MSQPPLHLLQTLAAFQEMGTVEKAAVLLKTTQPTVTRQLQQLEEWSRAPLFESKGRKKVLTEYGSELAAVCDRHFQSFAIDLQRARKRFTRPEQQTLRVCAPNSTLGDFFSTIDFPGHLEFVAIGEAEIAREILRQSTDVAVLTSQIETDDYIVRRLFTARLQLLMPKAWSPDVPSYREVARLCAEHAYCACTLSGDVVDLVTETLGLDESPVARTTCTDWSTTEARVYGEKAWALVPSNFASEGRGYWRVELPDTFQTESSFIYIRRAISEIAWMKNILAEIF